MATIWWILAGIVLLVAIIAAVGYGLRRLEARLEQEEIEQTDWYDNT